MRLDRLTLEAVASLRGSREFMVFCTSLDHELKKADVLLRSCTPETFQKVQGRAEVLAEILRNVASASDDIHALK